MGHRRFCVWNPIKCERVFLLSFGYYSIHFHNSILLLLLLLPLLLLLMAMLLLFTVITFTIATITVNATIYSSATSGVCLC